MRSFEQEHRKSEFLVRLGEAHRLHRSVQFQKTKVPKVVKCPQRSMMSIKCHLSINKRPIVILSSSNQWISGSQTLLLLLHNRQSMTDGNKLRQLIGVGVGIVDDSQKHFLKRRLRQTPVVNSLLHLAAFHVVKQTLKHALGSRKLIRCRRREGINLFPSLWQQRLNVPAQ
jgi:hypothetical protein